MPRFIVHGTVTVSAYTYVEAADEAAARLEAEARDCVLAGGINSWVESERWECAIIEEGDGSFVSTRVEPTDEKPDNDEDSE